MENQYMEMFLDESHEHLQSLNEGLLKLEENKDDVSVVNDIFRNAHTLKGMSATMGYNKIAELTHEMEDVLDLIRKEQLKLDENIIDILFKCLDSLEQMVDNVGNGDPEDLVDVSDLVKKLSAISKGEPVPDAAPAAAGAAPAADGAAANGIELEDVDRDVIRQAKKSGLQGIHVKVTLTEACVLKSARSYMVMNTLDELGDVIKSVPPAEDLEQEKFENSFDVLVVTDAEPKAIKDAILSISEIEKVECEEVDPDAQPAP
ncbi:MAG: Hpt domain-containing protein, partial [Mitsuokella sp.]